jgi:murein DD-endopeptidase MepM/ murein hydrolase activator NlpD
MGSGARKLLSLVILILGLGCPPHRDRTITFTEPPRPDTSKYNKYQNTSPGLTTQDTILSLDRKLERSGKTIDLGNPDPPKLEPSIARLWKRDTLKNIAGKVTAVTLDKIPGLTLNGPIQNITLDKNTYRQGEIAILTVSAVLPLAKAQIRFLGQNYKLYTESGTNYSTVLAVPMDTKEGDYSMALQYDEKGEKQTLKYPFKVVKGKFAKEDTVKMDIGVMTEETLEMLKYEGGNFWRAYNETSDSLLISGDFIWPCDGSITELYGTARDYNKKMDEWSHKALDIANAENTKILAANDGVVVMAMDLDAHGKSIVIDHGQGIQTVYLHLNDMKVKKGDKVKKGQVIGKLGQTGICTGPNLHWQIVVAGNSTDPRYWMKDGDKVKKGTWVKSEPPKE